MYLAKLDKEANYFTVKEEPEEDICTCATCIVSIYPANSRDIIFIFQASYEVIYADYMQHSIPGESVTSESSASCDQAPEQFTAEIMEEMLRVEEKNICVVM